MQTKKSDSRGCQIVSKPRNNFVFETGKCGKVVLSLKDVGCSRGDALGAEEACVCVCVRACLCKQKKSLNADADFGVKVKSEDEC